MDHSLISIALAESGEKLKNTFATTVDHRRTRWTPIDLYPPLNLKIWLPDTLLLGPQLPDFGAMSEIRCEISSIWAFSKTDLRYGREVEHNVRM